MFSEEFNKNSQITSERNYRVMRRKLSNILLGKVAVFKYYFKNYHFCSQEHSLIKRNTI